MFHLPSVFLSEALLLFSQTLNKKPQRFSHLRTMHLSKTVVAEESAFLWQSRKRIIGEKWSPKGIFLVD